MKRNYVLGSLVLSFIFCFGFACKHMSSSKTLATPEDYKQDCIKFVELNNRSGFLEEYEGVSFWEMDRVTQFRRLSNPDIELYEAYDELVYGTRLGAVSPVFLQDKSPFSRDKQSLIDVKCAALEQKNPNKYGIAALIVSGNVDSGNITCNYDVYDCDERAIVRSYSTARQEFTLKDLFTENCSRSDIPVYKENKAGKKWLVVNLPNSFKGCSKNLLYRDSKLLSSTSNTIAVELKGDMDSKINTIEDLLNYKLKYCDIFHIIAQ